MPAPKKSETIPESVLKLLIAADTRNGFPVGTMQSVLQQEVGGQLDKYLADPSTYHYAANKEGKRIAPHTGKVSTAFGPFGILESTAADPGYGVAPLASRNFEEQLRFAADYLAARTKRGGSLKAGLAGYGEGKAYADNVAGRLGVAEPGPAPVLMAAAPPAQAEGAPISGPAPTAPPSPVGATTVAGGTAVPLPAALLEYLASRGKPTPEAQAQSPGSNAWLAFLDSMRGSRGRGGEGVLQAPALQAEDINYGMVPRTTGVPAPMPSGRVDFGPFAGLNIRKRLG